MRVITGKYKGRRLETPVGNAVRPTSDKVKEAMFNLLMNDVYGSVCCDLFAGTGGLGIEALSRGAKKCYFCDISRDSIRLVHQNVEKCGAEEDSVIITGDFNRGLHKIREKVDIFLVDPPYRAGLYEKVLEQVDFLDLLADDGIILTECDSREIPPERVGGLIRYKERKYGKTWVGLYRHMTEEERDQDHE
ncbi:MAG: 16S rRNA (guanine(966)-N(2))-methyltransferase RsmD [Eubacteriales bacterium]|nr:16S rRNA (guanine(966)-N(2))-methyltransferase RsmD [Eubacteriales bacterium]